MTRRAVSSEQAPAALGPYSQAIVANGLVFCSGMAGIDPAGAVPEGIEAQTEQALTNLASVLEAAGASMNDWAKPTIFWGTLASEHCGVEISLGCAIEVRRCRIRRLRPR